MKAVSRILLLVGIDSGLIGNIHYLYQKQSVEKEWQMFHFSEAMRHVLLPVILLIFFWKEAGIMGRSLLMAYSGVELMDSADWILNDNQRDQSLDWAIFSALTLFIILYYIFFKWTLKR